MFRKALREKTPMGLVAKTYMDSGALVPDDVVIGLVEERLSADDCANGYMLDGYPRTVAQADALEALLKKWGHKLDHVINISSRDEVVVQRLTGRRTCLNCGATYHTMYNPPKVDQVCDVCGEEVVQREDDSESTVLNRLDVYKKQTEPLLNYYRERGLLRNINGEQSIDSVYMDVCRLLEG